MSVKVDPRFTSQRCCGCGIIDKTNRNKSHYKCKCGYSDHADINAAKNIAALHLSGSKSWATKRTPKQAAVNQPHVTLNKSHKPLDSS